MAWRIDEAVVYGEIDNTVEGRTTGRIWLRDRDEPLILSLDGDCWRDLAGTRLQFENPDPRPNADARALDVDQTGMIGDMTASRKTRVPTVDDEEQQRLYHAHAEIPAVWCNTLYLEWFSEINGRVVIESHRFHLTISTSEWEMDEDAEEAQKLSNLNSMRDFMSMVIRRRETETKGAEVDGELDEFAWEERLKESDRLTEAYQEVLEKYMEDSDSERKEAFVMGWDGLLEALAERDESLSLKGSGSISEFSSGDEEIDFDLDDSEDEEEHPMQIQARELALQAMSLTDDNNLEAPSQRLVENLLQISGKLASVLEGRGTGSEPETGFILAILKRCLNWLNEAVGDCQSLLKHETNPDQKTALARLLDGIFEIRDHIVELRRELKQS